MTLNDIENEFLTTEDITPHRLAELLIQLSAQYAKTSNELEQALLTKPTIWSELRKNHKTVAETDRAWEATDAGLQELHTSMQLKKIEKLMSSARTMITVRTNEAHNLY